MTPSIISLIPPIILFVVACATSNILIAFSAGIAAALCIIANANPMLMVTLLLNQTWQYFSDQNVIVLFLFLIAIGGIITILSVIKERVTSRVATGTTKRSFIKTARTSEYVSMFFSFFI